MKIIKLKESIYYGLFWRGQGHWLPSDINFVRILCGKDEIVKKPILDEVEKEDWSNVIKPFRDRVGWLVIIPAKRHIIH